MAWWDVAWVENPWAARTLSPAGGGEAAVFLPRSLAEQRRMARRGPFVFTFADPFTLRRSLFLPLLSVNPQENPREMKLRLELLRRAGLPYGIVTLASSERELRPPRQIQAFLRFLGETPARAASAFSALSRAFGTGR